MGKVVEYIEDFGVWEVVLVLCREAQDAIVAAFLFLLPLLSRSV